jgi:thiosulfate/3-mercaptopyruvate sulfurtransferase
METAETAPAAATVAARPIPSLVVDLERVRDVLAEGSAQVVDARSAPRFRGETPEPRAGLRSGHMPGALNVPFNLVVAPDGTLKSREALAEVFAGVDLARPIITTCGSGVTAAVLALALARLGRDDVAVYDGSWTEWGGRADAPVVTGA